MIEAWQDSRIGQDLQCGVTQPIEGKEWICIAKVHDDGHHSLQDHRGVSARGRRHYWVRRYPNSNH